ncbi:hypothetical protein, partial [Paenibacillus naphthalenovorans]|uniref:hypothetical protein n=1 Tax=Paenibacillus naphthalenovorans TaxID=162209 RepID=UPI003D2E4849
MGWSPPNGAFDPTTGAHLTQLTGSKVQDQINYNTTLSISGQDAVSMMNIEYQNSCVTGKIKS